MPALARNLLSESPITPANDRVASTESIIRHALTHGAAALTDEDLLTLILARDSEDPALSAHQLIAEFGSLAWVACAPELHLQRQVNPRAALNISLGRELATRILREPVHKGEAISSSTALNRYLRLTMSRHPIEFVRVLYLDSHQKVIRDESQGDGDLAASPIYPRQVVRRALDLGAHGIIMAHGHPSQSPSPSRADIDTTRKIRDGCEVFSIQLHDHIIVAGDELVSMRGLGLI